MPMSAGISVLAAFAAGCAASAGKASAAKICPSQLTAGSSSESVNHFRENQELNLESGVTGMQVLRGWMDLTWDADGQRKQKRCAMTLVPEVGDGMQIKIATANRCLPDAPQTSGSIVEAKVNVLFRDGYIPLTVNIPNLNEVMRMGAVINKYLVPLIPASKLHSWLPNYAASSCTGWTQTFRQTSAPGTKTACFSRTDLRIIDAKVIETSPKSLSRYQAALLELNRVKGAALADLPLELSRGIQILWREANLDDSRKRNLRTMAFLSNVQYCAATTFPPPENIAPENQIFFDLYGDKLFCNMSADLRDALFNTSATTEEYARLKEIQADATTPFLELRNRFMGCEPPVLLSAEMNPCQVTYPTRAFFTKWVRDGAANFQLLSDAQKKGLAIDDYFNVVAPSHSGEKDVGVNYFRLASNTERVAPVGGNIASFIFDYLPSKNYFQFQKGDSRSVLNIFSGYPVAVLSTIDGEPTSGGASITALPEPVDDQPSSSKVNGSCR